jgi:hypothetical protein
MTTAACRRSRASGELSALGGLRTSRHQKGADYSIVRVLRLPRVGLLDLARTGVRSSLQVGHPELSSQVFPIRLPFQGPLSEWDRRRRLRIGGPARAPRIVTLACSVRWRSSRMISGRAPRAPLTVNSSSSQIGSTSPSRGQDLLGWEPRGRTQCVGPAEGSIAPVDALWKNCSQLLPRVPLQGTRL